jgi:hypothetical protein
MRAAALRAARRAAAQASARARNLVTYSIWNIIEGIVMIWTESMSFGIGSA